MDFFIIYFFQVTLHSINRQMEKQESNLRQLKHAIRQSRISIHNSALNPSSSECSYDVSAGKLFFMFHFI